MQQPFLLNSKMAHKLSTSASTTGCAGSPQGAYCRNSTFPLRSTLTFRRGLTIISFWGIARSPIRGNDFQVILVASDTPRSAKVRSLLSGLSAAETKECYETKVTTKPSHP